MASTSSLPLNRGLRSFGNQMNKYNFIYIHDLKSWSVSQLKEFFYNKIPNCLETIPSIKKPFSPKYGSYFIIRVNITKTCTNFLNILLLLLNGLPVTSKIYWSSWKQNKCKKRSKCKIQDISLKPMSKEFFNNHLNSHSNFFNLCASWNINGWNYEKRDSIIYLNSVFKPACICLQEIGKSKLLPKDSNSPIIPDYKSVYLRADPNIPGMRGLFIGVHTSCSFFQEPFIYKYIISVTITSFWNQKCTIGNIYFPQTKWKEERINAFVELSHWLNFHDKNDSPAILVGDFNMSLTKIKSYISRHYPEWTVATLQGNQFTYAKGTRSSCIDHVIFNKSMATHVNKTSVCTSFFGISDHKPIIFSCKKTLSDDFIRPTKTFKWSTHICNTKDSTIFSHNYFSVLAEDLDSHKNVLTADGMVNKFLETSTKVGKDIKAFVPSKLHGSAFHCPYFIKKLSHEKHNAYMNIKPFFNCENVNDYLSQMNNYLKICKTIKKVKSKFRSARYKANIIKIGKHFMNKEYRSGWQGLKKIAKPSYSVSPSPSIKSKDGHDLVSSTDQLHRWAEHYKDLFSDSTGHSLNRTYWNYIFHSFPYNEFSWNINDPISIPEIQNIVLSMKNNKAPGPDGLPIEFYKAFFRKSNQNETNEENFSNAAKCLEIIFNKIWNGSFPKEWNSASIVSIPKKGDLSDCNNYRGISLINVGLKIISKIVTERISKYALSHNYIRPEQFGFRNHEECISLFISIREICQRRKFNGQFTYLAFLDLKKAYDSVPIFNILTKLYHLGIRGKCFDFLSNLYLSSKARARFLDMLSDEFSIKRGVRQGCPLSPILFNLFINDILDNCAKYGVSIGNKKCCGGLFADDIVLIAPSEKNLSKLLKYVF